MRRSINCWHGPPPTPMQGCSLPPTTLLEFLGCWHISQEGNGSSSCLDRELEGSQQNRMNSIPCYKFLYTPRIDNNDRPSQKRNYSSTSVMISRFSHHAGPYCRLSVQFSVSFLRFRFSCACLFGVSFPAGEYAG